MQLKKSLKEKKSNLNKTQIFAVIEVGLLLAAGLALALPNAWDMSGFAANQPEIESGQWGNMDTQYAVIEATIPVFTSHQNSNIGLGKMMVQNGMYMFSCQA